MNWSSRKKVLVGAISLFALILAVLSYLGYRALWTGNVSAIKANPSTSVVDKVRTAEKQGGTVELSEADINGLFSIYTKKGLGNEFLSVKGLYAEIANDQIALNIPVNFKGINLLLYSQGKIALENDLIVFSPAVVKLGKLTLPKNFVLNNLSRYLKDKITVTDDSLIVKKSTLPFDVRSLAISGDKVVIAINKFAGESLAAGNLSKESNGSTGSTSNDSGNNSVAIIKPLQPETSASVSNPEENKDKPTESQGSNNTPSSDTVVRTELLRKASGELNGVYASVKTANEKQIIAKIQSVVNIMVQNPSYAYQAEANVVRSQYNKLSAEEKNDFKETILTKMNPDTLRQIKIMFKL